jgi:hypothetical protein
MHVNCIKCNKKGTLSLNHYKSHSHTYKYYGIQHYDPTTKKRRWCYLGKYESLPEPYKIVIHKKESLSTTHPQTQKKLKSTVFSEKAWCGGWDSNPRSPEARDLESCAFSLPAGIDLALPPPPPP